MSLAPSVCLQLWGPPNVLVVVVVAQESSSVSTPNVDLINLEALGAQTGQADGAIESN